MWEKREFRGLADDVEIGTRNIKLALRRLRKFVRDGAEDEFDLDGTIRATAENAGYLDIKMVPERKNRVKVLLFLDIGGSMDSHIRVSEELFSAARSELKHLEYFYFHNFLYERVCARTGAATTSGPRPGTCSTPTRRITRRSSWATRP